MLIEVFHKDLQHVAEDVADLDMEYFSHTLPYMTSATSTYKVFSMSSSALPALVLLVTWLFDRTRLFHATKKPMTLSAFSSKCTACRCGLYEQITGLAQSLA